MFGPNVMITQSLATTVSKGGALGVSSYIDPNASFTISSALRTRFGWEASLAIPCPERNRAPPKRLNSTREGGLAGGSQNNKMAPSREVTHLPLASNRCWQTHRRRHYGVQLLPIIADRKLKGQCLISAIAFCKNLRTRFATKLVGSTCVL